MDGNAGKTGKIVRLVCAVLLVLAALAYALLLAAENACDLGIAGGLSRLFAVVEQDERHTVVVLRFHAVVIVVGIKGPSHFVVVAVDSDVWLMCKS